MEDKKPIKRRNIDLDEEINNKSKEEGNIIGVLKGPRGHNKNYPKKIRKH